VFIKKPFGMEFKMMQQLKYMIPAESFEAIIFDLDGVITDTASIHAQAWKRMFDNFLMRHSKRKGVPFKPFEIETD
jgi:alpha,alpha-trehalase